jgi:outer membrane beta-barrel protein
MNRYISMSSLVIILGLSGWHASVAYAQPSTQDAQIYAGYLFGDRLLEQPLSGSTPRLNDNATYGARYTYHFTDQWGVQLSTGYSPDRNAHVASGTRNFGLTTVDLDLEWDVPLNFQLAGRPLVPYGVVGAGYAWANFDSMSGVIGTTLVTISDSNSYTANAGLGVKYFLKDNIFVDFDSRYRYMNRLVNNFGQDMNTAQTTLGVGFRF